MPRKVSKLSRSVVTNPSENHFVSISKIVKQLLSKNLIIFTIVSFECGVQMPGENVIRRFFKPVCGNLFRLFFVLVMEQGQRFGDVNRYFFFVRLFQKGIEKESERFFIFAEVFLYQPEIVADFKTFGGNDDGASIFFQRFGQPVLMIEHIGIIKMCVQIAGANVQSLFVIFFGSGEIVGVGGKIGKVNQCRRRMRVKAQ